jgi:tetratricopeptide (TPR) repeat protein
MSISSPDAPQAPRRRKRHPPWVRLVFALTAILLVTGGAISIMVWWEDRPIRQIEAALGRKDYQRALELVDRFLKQSPDQSRALEQKARALAGLGRWNEAERMFELNGVISLESRRAWAEALLHQQRWTEALPLLVEVSREAPDNADVLHELAACQGQLGYFEEAVAAAEKLSKMRSHERQGLLLLGMLQYRRGNNRLAIQAWTPLFESSQPLNDLQSTEAELREAMGRALLDDGRPAEALPHLEQACLDEVSDDTWLALADTRDSLGNRAGAVEIWKKIVEHDPNSRQAREGLARDALERRAPQEALEWLRPLLERDKLIRSSTAHLAQRAANLAGDKETAAKWDQRAKSLREQERRTAALEQTLRESPRSFWSRCIRAHRFATDGNRPQALLLARELLLQRPDEEFVQKLVASLERDAPLPKLDEIPLQKQH